MARGKAPLVALAPTGVLLSGASVVIVDRSTGSPAVCYGAETGIATVGQPLATDPRGRVQVWLDRGGYTATFSYAGLGVWSEDFDIAPARDGSLDPAWLPDNFLAARHIPTGLIALAKLADDVLPPGLIVPWASATPPTGWIACDGSLKDRTVYAKLFTLVGHAFNGGVDPGSNQFRLPDLRGRTVVGPDNMGSGTAGRLTANNAIAASGGTESVVLTIAQLPSHAHGGVTGGANSSHTHSINMARTTGAGSDTSGTGVPPHNGVFFASIGNATGGPNADHSHNITAEGGGGSHPNTQPYLVANWIVKT